jgi:hypothetical protein
MLPPQYVEIFGRLYECFFRKIVKKIKIGLETLGCQCLDALSFCRIQILVFEKMVDK